jgi:pyruvate dehydrogenase E2 component (dihydrolipoamide acetyltransferase)
VARAEPTRVQQAVSRRAAESKATAPDYSLSVDVDMTACVELRERMSGMADPVPTLNDMVIKAAASALRTYPRVNGAYRDGGFESYSRVNVAFVVATEDALIAPTVLDADERSLGEIARRTVELAAKARDGSITAPELAGATFTVSNLGMHGIDSFTGVITPPQAALLTAGAVKRRPVGDEHGRIVLRHVMTATLTCDHRILYGPDAAAFLAHVREQLENTAALAL